MSCLPEHLQGRRYYEPTDRGVEGRIREALDRARRLRGGRGPDADEGKPDRD
jgi:replication-associated recombination protein RarA